MLDILRADAFLSSFFVDRNGESCIIRITGSTNYPETQWPIILVYQISQARSLAIGPTCEMTCSIGVTLLYDELRDEVGDEEIGVQSFAECIVRALSSDSAVRLVVSRWGLTRATVNKLERWSTLYFGPALKPEEVKMVEEAERTDSPLPSDFRPSGLAIELQFDYSYTVERSTMTPSNFSSEE